MIRCKRKMCECRWGERHATDQRTPLEKEIELADGQRDRIVALLAPEPREAAALEPLRIDTQPRAVPVDRLRAYPITADESVQAPYSESSRKSSERGEELESRAAQGVLRDGDRGVRVAGAALGVDDFDVGRGAGAEADVDDGDDLPRLIGRGARAGR